MDQEALSGPASSESTQMHGAILAWFALALILVARALRRSASDLGGLTRYFNLVVLLLLGQAGVRVAYAVISNLQPLTPVSHFRPAAHERRAEQRPDIYLIVLDKYTGSLFLSPTYGLDNSGFEASLRTRGFVVPKASRANYVQTFLSLASMLNLRYLDHLPEIFGESNSSWNATYPLIEHNALASFLQERGYRFLFFPTAFPATEQNRTADVQLPKPEQMKREFIVAWERTTLIPALHHLWCAAWRCRANRWPYVPESADFFDWKFEQLAAVGGADQPVFVFAHVLLPHEPYLYRRDCIHREPFWPSSDEGVFEPLVKAAYAEQIQCVNAKLQAMIDGIIRRSRTPPVILIQADHGHGRFGRLVPPLDSVLKLPQKSGHAVRYCWRRTPPPAGPVSGTHCSNAAGCDCRSRRCTRRS